MPARLGDMTTHTHTHIHTHLPAHTEIEEQDLWFMVRGRCV